MTLQICWIFSSFFLIGFLDLSLPRRRVIAGHAAPTRLGPKKGSDTQPLLLSEFFFWVLFQVLNTWRGWHFMTTTSKGPKDFFQNSTVNLEAKYLLFRIFVWLRWMAIHPHGFDWPSETLNSWSFQVYSYTSNLWKPQTLSLETTRGASNFGAGKCNDGARSAYWTTPLCFFVRTVQQCN